MHNSSVTARIRGSTSPTQIRSCSEDDLWSAERLSCLESPAFTWDGCIVVSFSRRSGVDVQTPDVVSLLFTALCAGRQSSRSCCHDILVQLETELGVTDNRAPKITYSSYVSRFIGGKNLGPKENGSPREEAHWPSASTSSEVAAPLPASEHSPNCTPLLFRITWSTTWSSSRSSPSRCQHSLRHPLDMMGLQSSSRTSNQSPGSKCQVTATTDRQIISRNERLEHWKLPQACQCGSAMRQLAINSQWLCMKQDLPYHRCFDKQDPQLSFEKPWTGKHKRWYKFGKQRHSRVLSWRSDGGWGAIASQLENYEVVAKGWRYLYQA